MGVVPLTTHSATHAFGTLSSASYHSHHFLPSMGTAGVVGVAGAAETQKSRAPSPSRSSRRGSLRLHPLPHARDQERRATFTTGRPSATQATNSSKNGNALRDALGVNVHQKRPHIPKIAALAANSITLFAAHFLLSRVHRCFAIAAFKPRSNFCSDAPRSTAMDNKLKTFASPSLFALHWLS